MEKNCISEILLEAKLSMHSVILSHLLSATVGFADNSEYSKKPKATALTASPMNENAQIICNRFSRAFFGSRKSFEFLAGRAGVVDSATRYPG